jgi:peptide/nickel transport system substrate-binding protein
LYTARAVVFESRMPRRHALPSILLLANACAPGAVERRPLEVVIPTEVATLDPRFSTRSFDIKLTRLVHAGLVGLNPSTLAPEPLLARSLRFADERTLEVELRPGLRFHSGRELGADDVCATIEALSDPRLGSPHRAVVRAIGSCVPRSRYSLTIRLAEPRATLLTDLEVPILRADQASLPARDDLDGLGPYRVSRAQPSEVLLEPADTGALPRPEHAVVVRSVRDENARALRLLAGRSDIAPNAISPALLPALEARDGLQIRARAGANVSYMLVHNERPPFDRVEVRRGLSVAIDRALLTRTLLAGRAQPARWIFPPGHWASPADLPEPAHDPAAARQALTGLRRVTLLTSTDRARVTIARAIAQMLGDAGLEVDVLPLDFGVLLHRLDAGDFELATLQMPELTEPNLLAWFFHPRGVPGEGAGKNRARWRSADAGRLLDAASAVREIAARKPPSAAPARLMQREMPVVPLWHEDQVAVVSERAATFLPSAEGRWQALAALP